jgi:uncharacterized protein (UPF0179 family)
MEGKELENRVNFVYIGSSKLCEDFCRNKWICLLWGWGIEWKAVTKLRPEIDFS